MLDVKSLNKTAGWKRVAFGDVVRLCTERSSSPEANGFERYVGLEHLDPGELRVRRWGDIANGVTFTNVFRSGQVLFGKRRAYQRKVGVADFSGVCSGDIYVLEPKGDALLHDLLPFICRTDAFFAHAVGTSAGSLSPRTNWDSLANFEFDLPPIEEQRRIADVLVASQSLVDALGNARRGLERSLVSTRNALYSGYGGDRTRKDTPLGPLPCHWEVKRLDEVFDFLNTMREPLKDSARQARPGPYPYYGASGQIDSVDDYRFNETTILLAEDGMNLLFRTLPVAYKASGKYWVSNHAHVLRPREGVCVDFYLDYLNFISFVPYLTGGDQKKLTKANCARIQVVLPPVEDQLTISDTCSRLRGVGAQIEGRRKAVNAMQMRILAEFAA